MANVLIEFEGATFDCFTLDTRRRELLARGVAVPLDAKPFDLLVYLIARRTEAVSRDDILADVWQGRIVDPGNVAVQLSALRGALKKAGAAGNLIVTLPGPRYRFVGDVAFHDSHPRALHAGDALQELPSAVPVAALSAAPAKARLRLGIVTLGPAVLLAGLFAALGLLYPIWFEPNAASEPLRIAVRPFRDNTATPRTDILADEITDDLRDDLAHIQQSIVTDRESVEHFKDQPPDRLAQALNVRYVVEGSVSLEDSEYYVSASLVDTAKNGSVWRRPYHEHSDRMSVVREKLVRAIARDLHLQIDQLEASHSQYDRPNSQDAMDCFRIARARLDMDDSPEAYRTAQGLLEKAVAQRPDFGDALALLGWVLLRKNQSVDDQAEGDRDWVEAADKIRSVLNLAPRNALARTVRARQLFMENKIHDAQLAAEMAEQDEYSNVDAHWVLADCAWGLGQLDKEEAELAVVGDLNPDGLLNKQRLLMLGAIKLLQNDPQSAIKLLTQSTTGDPELAAGDDGGARPQYARLLLVAAYGLANQPQKASETYAVYNQRWPNRSVWRFEATLPRAIDAMPSAKAMFNALRSAGMPLYADGSAALDSSDADCEDDYSKTPTALPRGRILETRDMEAVLAGSEPPLIIDVSLFGTGAIKSAEWFDPADPARSTEDFVDHVVSERLGAAKSQPVIVMGDGPFGCTAFKMAGHLIENHYQNVEWYRGGEEAWVSSGHQYTDHRPE